MKIMKQISLLVLTIIIIIGVCGCMNHNEYSEIICNELKNKYGQNFEIVSLNYEISGQSGNYYRAVCRAEGDDRTFVSYYYFNGTKYLLLDEAETADLPKRDAVFVDEYSDLLLNKKYEDYIVEKNSNIVFAIAEIKFLSHDVSAEDVERGIETVLNGEQDAIVKLYIFADNSIVGKDEFEKEIVEQLLEDKIYQHSVDIAYISRSDSTKVIESYKDDTYRIRDRAEEDDAIARYSWYLLGRDRGIITKNDIKGD